MSKMVRNLLLAALLLFVGSFATCVIGSQINDSRLQAALAKHDVYPISEVDGSFVDYDSRWDYAWAAMAIIAVGLILAAWRARSEDKNEESR